MGNRLWETTKKTPKSLLPFGDGTILSNILDNLSQAGIEGFVIVTGFNAGYIHDYIKEHNSFGHNVTFVRNDEWQRGNGISVLLSEDAVNGEPFILSMSDHIVSVQAIKRIIESPNEKNLLLVDKAIDDIFDIDDATKVFLENDLIVNIGKEITHYNGVDCGIFKLNSRFFKAMRRELEAGLDSISAAINRLIHHKDMAAVFLKNKESWIDIDTLEAYEHAKQHIMISRTD